MATDLFGAIPEGEAVRQERAAHKRIKARGYAMPPGTGPEGHTCGDCAHIYRTDRYRKCELMRKHWTHGYGTDVLARSPACGKWEQKEA